MHDIITSINLNDKHRSGASNAVADNCVIINGVWLTYLKKISVLVGLQAILTFLYSSSAMQCNEGTMIRFSMEKTLFSWVIKWIKSAGKKEEGERLSKQEISHAVTRNGS